MLIVYVLLNNGKGHCSYDIDQKCSHYEKRTPACKLYPVNPYFDHILVDAEFPVVSKEHGKVLFRNGVLQSDFYTKRLDNFVVKRETTRAFLDSIQRVENFDYLEDVLELPLLRCNQPSDNEYIKMHLHSLNHLDRFLLS